MTRHWSVPNSVSTLALVVALAAGPSPAAAQSFQGSGSFTNGAGSINTTTGPSPGDNTTTVTVDTAQSVIDWDASDDAIGNFGAINFQPAGTTATFQNNPDLIGNFAVLNRINIADQTRIVALNGLIQSQVNGQTGGSIFFYSPSGFVLTATSVINVGSLVLSASPITVDGNGSFINGGTVQFGQAPNPNAAINVVSDVIGTAQINASGSGSYVALVAPTILHQGDIRTDGAAALVAAEAATITFSPDGLFTIQVTQGTDAAVGIDVDGGTIGRLNPADGGDHHAYLVAVARNDAVDMVIRNGGSVGFETATSALVENNVVVLAGGYDVTGGQALSQVNVRPVNLSVDRASFSSNVEADLSGGAFIRSISGVTDFDRNLSITAGDDVTILASNGNDLTIGGNLFVDADRFGGGVAITGNTVGLVAQGGSTLSIGGNVALSAEAFGASSTDDGLTATNATGGTVSLLAQGTGSTITVGGNLGMTADGHGGDVFFGTGTGGTGTGGDADILANLGGTISVTGDTNISVEGSGGGSGECFGCDEVGADGTGGDVRINAAGATGNSITLGGTLDIFASGHGGPGGLATGNGKGGTLSPYADSGTITVVGAMTAQLDGSGGFGFNSATGGIGEGGTLNISFGLGGGTMTFADLDAQVEGRGGGGFDGGLGRGGDMSFSTANGGTINVGGVADFRAEGDGGGASGGDAGDAEGGNFVLQTQGGTVAFASDVSASTNAQGGSTESGGDGGDAVAGETIMVANGGGTLTVGADLTLTAISQGGSGVNGGDAITFLGINPRDTATTSARLIANNGAIIIDGSTQLDVSSMGGSGNSGGSGGDAAAGFAAFHAANSNGGPSSITAGGVSLTADATGGRGGDGVGGGTGGDGGNGGNASSGFAVATAAAGNGTLTVGDIVLSASATGGDGGAGGNGDGGAGGNGGNGGSATARNDATATRGITVGTESGLPEATATNAGSATFASITARANATGGDGGGFSFGSPNGIAGDGGNASAGWATLLVRGSPLTVGDVLLEALATGGDGGFDANDAIEGAGGKAVAGATFVIVTNRNQIAAQRGTLEAGAITAVAGASGGEGPGAGFGGSYLVDGSVFELINSEATIDSYSMTVTAPDGYDPAATVTNAGRIAVIGGSAVVTGDFNANTAGRLSVHADNATLGASTFDLTAGNFVHDETRAVPANVGTISATNIFLTTGQDLIVDAHLDSVNGVGFTAPGLIDLENVESNGPIALTAGATVDAGTLTAGTLVAVNGGGSINVGNILAGTQQVVVQTTAGDISTGTITAGTFAGLNGPGDVTTGNINAAGDIQVDAGGSITTGNATSTGGSIFMDAGDAITTGNLSALNFVELDAFGDIDFGNVNADDFDAETDGDVTGGNIIAGTFAGVEAVGSITLGDIAVGTIRTGGASEDGFAVGLVSATSITTGDVEADESIGFATLGNLTTGDLDAGYGVMALVGGNMSLGSITTPGNGLVYLADSSMFLDAGGPDEFDPLQVLALDPVPTGGSITINGPVTTGTFQAAAGTSLTTGAIDAGSIYAIAGGLLSINGLWAAEEVEAWSDDIAIAATGGIDAGATGTITLVSSNTNGAFIGDGLTGTGYNLTNAEFGRLQSGNLEIVAGVGPDAAGQMTIGDLDITGPLVGSTIDDPNGGVTFATLNEAGTATDGQIRIVGEVKAAGFGANNFLEFLTENFNLDADTGSIRIEGSGGALGGILDITADRIHVASGAVLDKLDDDPLYEGREADLAAPLATARPEGVIAADTIWVSPVEAVLVQNTGTASLRAGFLAREIELFAPEGAAPGSIELIVNGQLVTESGTLTGVAVRDALVLDTDLSIYSDNSSINGCPLVGACGTFGGPGFTPLPGIPDEVRLIDRGKLPPPFFGNEDFIDDNDELTDDGATSPIKPPQPLFDTRPLDQKGDVDDPVSGSGNPALMSPPAGGDQQ